MASDAEHSASDVEHALSGEDEIDLALDGLGLSDDPGTTPVPVLTKSTWVAPTAEQRSLLHHTILNLLKEGQGETVYNLGVMEGEPSGYSEEDLVAATATLVAIADECNADVTLLRKKKEELIVGEFLVRNRCAPEEFFEVRVAVVGNVDAGKSTLLGVLTHNELDDGRGKSRQRIFRHKHESDTGRTSSIGNDILGFDSKGRIVNETAHDGSISWTNVCAQASKVMTFIDLAGHEKYLKTTVFGLTGHLPHYAMLMIGSNMGIVGTTKEHLGLALALNVPVFVVLTKIDMCPPNVLESTLTVLQRILKSPGCRKIPLLVRSIDDVVVAALNFVSERVCPIFQVSNVTGANLDLLRAFLNLLHPNIPANVDAPAEFQIDEIYSVPGVGTVVSGTALAGIIRPNDTLLLGPNSHGEFLPCTIKAIHRRRTPAKLVSGGQTASLALKKYKRADIRKGMVLMAPAANPKAAIEFEGEIVILHHPTTIGCRYQAMVHCGSVKQTATIIGLDKDVLRTGDKALARFRFVRHPEYLRPGTRLIFREGRTKAVGTVTRIFPEVSIPDALASDIKQNKFLIKRAQQAAKPS